MYTLRIVKKSDKYGVSNTYLGKHYIVSRGKHELSVKGESKAFLTMFKKYFQIDDDCNVADDDEYLKKICAFISGDNGSVLMPIYCNDEAYIVMPNGKTLEKIN